MGLLLSEIGRVNSIEVSQDEVNQALLREAQRHPGQEREVYEYFQRTPEALANLRAPIFEDKVIDYIVEMADVTDEATTPDELRKAVEEERPTRRRAGRGDAFEAIEPLRSDLAVWRMPAIYT